MADNETNTVEEPTDFAGIDEAMAFLNKKPKPSDDDVSSDDESDDEEAETITDNADEEGDDEDEEIDDESEDSDEDDEESEAKFTPFTVGEGDDAVVVKTREEAIAGFMRQKHFTKVTTEMKKTKENLANLTEQLVSSKSEYLQALGTLRASMHEGLRDFVGVDWIALEKDDPLEFEAKSQAFSAAKLAYEQVLATEQEQSAKYTEEQKAVNEAKRNKALDELVLLRPDVAEGDVFEKAVKFMADNYGLTTEQVLGIEDAPIEKMWAAMFDLSQKRPARKSKGKVVNIKAKAKDSTTKQERQDKKRQVVLNADTGVDFNTALKALGINRG